MHAQPTIKNPIKVALSNAAPSEDAIFRPYRQEGISEALSVLATSAPACSSSPLFEPSFILPSNMSSASTHPMKSPTSKFQLLMARMDMFQNGMNHIMQKVKNTSEDQQLLLKLVDDIALEVQHLITTSFPGKIEHARKNDHSIEATTKSNDPLQTVAKTLANLHQHLPVPYNKIYFGS